MNDLSEMEKEQKRNPTIGRTMTRRAKPGGPKAPLFRAHIHRDPKSDKWWVKEDEKRFTRSRPLPPQFELEMKIQNEPLREGDAIAWQADYHTIPTDGQEVISARAMGQGLPTAEVLEALTVPMLNRGALLFKNSLGTCVLEKGELDMSMFTVFVERTAEDEYEVILVQLAVADATKEAIAEYIYNKAREWQKNIDFEMAAMAKTRITNKQDAGDVGEEYEAVRSGLDEQPGKGTPGNISDFGTTIINNQGFMVGGIAQSGEIRNSEKAESHTVSASWKALATMVAAGLFGVGFGALIGAKFWSGGAIEAIGSLATSLGIAGKLGGRRLMLQAVLGWMFGAAIGYVAWDVFTSLSAN